MLNLGLTWQQSQDLHNLLKGPHRVKVSVHLLDKYLNFIRDISEMLLEGTLDIDTEADVTKSVGLKLADPMNMLGFDNVNPAQSINYFGRYMRVFYSVSPLYGTNPGGIQEYTYPIFTGPVTDYNKNGPVVDVELQGKEVLASKGTLRAISINAGSPKPFMLLYLLRSVIGETHTKLAYDGIYNNAWTSQPWNVEAGTNLWLKCKELAFSMGCQLYYDAWGVATMRPSPSLNYPVFTFDDTWLTTKPEVERNFDDLFNAIRVVGGAPQGWDGIYSVELVAPPNHPLSGENLSTAPGTPLYLPRFIEDDTLTDYQSVYIVGQMALNESLMLGLGISFTSVVLPFLEEGDTYAMNSKTYFGYGRFDKATIPLVGDYTMSVGFLSNVSLANSNAWSNRVTGTTEATDAPLVAAALKERMKLIEKRERERLAKAKKRRENRMKRKEKRREKKRKKKYKSYGIFKVDK